MRRLTWLAPFLGVLAAGCPNPEPPPKDHYMRLPVPPDADLRPDAEPPPAPVPAPTLAAIDGADAAAGKALFAKLCAGCHGADGRGQTAEAKKLRFPPTDLATVGYLCRTTDARPFAVPADGDIEGALGRGAHQGDKAIAALDPVARRSLTLHVKTLAREFANPTSPLFVVPAEPPDDAASRARGRSMYLATGCWRCHGVDGGGGEPAALANIRWNDLPIAKLHPLADQDGYRCGSSPEAVYRVVALGLVGTRATIMPRYQELAETFEKPRKGTPAEWTKNLEGKVSAEEIAAVQAWIAAQPEHAAVAAMGASAKRARAASMLWDLTHYVRSL